MTKSKSSAWSIIVPSIFVMHLANGAQFLNAICVAPGPGAVMWHLTKM